MFKSKTWRKKRINEGWKYLVLSPQFDCPWPTPFIYWTSVLLMIRVQHRMWALPRGGLYANPSCLGTPTSRLAPTRQNICDICITPPKSQPTVCIRTSLGLKQCINVISMLMRGEGLRRKNMNKYCIFINVSLIWARYIFPLILLHLFPTPFPSFLLFSPLSFPLSLLVFSIFKKPFSVFLCISTTVYTK